MDFSGSQEQAAEFARAALDMMEQKGIPATPCNFAVWFHYFSDKYPGLHQTLDAMLVDDHDFSVEENDELFQKFFGLGREAAALQETATKVESELGKILKYLEAAGEGAAAYGKALESASGKIETAEESTDLKSVITNLFSATQAMQQHNEAIETRFKTSSSEINRLKDDLEAMRQEALTDGLTGISNRKLFDMALSHAANEVEESGETFSLLMIDIDHFKLFNDRFGHQVGDQVLKLLATTLSSIIKGQDTAARYGGEEFAVILPHTIPENAARLAEVIRKTINGKKVVNRSTSEDLGQISVSIGVSGFVPGEAVSQLISRADAALYDAKSNGRNQVAILTD